MVTRGFKRLQGITRGSGASKSLQEVTRDYKRLQKVTRG